MKTTGAILCILLAAFTLYSCGEKEKDSKLRRPPKQNKNTGKKKPGSDTPQVEEPKFRKDGELVFIDREDASKVLRKIAIEKAVKPEARYQGLMYRKSLPDSLGMLFIFDRSEPQSFWMKNTYISLDILFVNENREIVKIHKNTKPQSTSSLPSGKPALYVVEVIGGFCDKYGVEEGDNIAFL